MLAIASTSTIEKILWIEPRFELPQISHCLSLLGIAWSFVLIAMGGFRLGKFARIMPEPAKKAPLRTTGAYAFCRHPMYSGFLMAGFFWSTYLGSYLAFVYTMALFLVLLFKIRIEEKFLKKLHGKIHDDYKKKVGMLLPKLFNKDFWK